MRGRKAWLTALLCLLWALPLCGQAAGMNLLWEIPPGSGQEAVQAAVLAKTGIALEQGTSTGGEAMLASPDSPRMTILGEPVAMQADFGDAALDRVTFNFVRMDGMFFDSPRIDNWQAFEHMDEALALYEGLLALYEGTYGLPTDGVLLPGDALPSDTAAQDYPVNAKGMLDQSFFRDAVTRREDLLLVTAYENVSVMMRFGPQAVERPASYRIEILVTFDYAAVVPAAAQRGEVAEKPVQPTQAGPHLLWGIPADASQDQCLTILQGKGIAAEVASVSGETVIASGTEQALVMFGQPVALEVRYQEDALQCVSIVANAAGDDLLRAATAGDEERVAVVDDALAAYADLLAQAAAKYGAATGGVLYVDQVAYDYPLDGQGPDWDALRTAALAGQAASVVTASGNIEMRLNIRAENGGTVTADMAMAFLYGEQLASADTFAAEGFTATGNGLYQGMPAVLHLGF